VLRNVNHTTLHVAYSYYYFLGSHNLTDLQKDLLILAKNKGYDVFNALDIMQNDEYLKELKFGIGDGNLHYYFYNWRIQKLNPNDMAMVLV
jgi:glycylpeptide N-tetradecanoyltransferase